MPKTVFLSALGLIVAVGLVACGDEEAGNAGGGAGEADTGVAGDQGVGDGVSDAGVADGSGDVSPFICATSSECTALPGLEGTLCVDGACVACESDAECVADPAYGMDGVCNRLGRCAVCSRTLVGCECSGRNRCEEGECVDGLCADCVVGSLGCVCYEDTTCEVGSQCGEVSGLCEACPEGQEGCPCVSPDATCDDGLNCLMGLCAGETCDVGQAGCPCNEDDTCEDDVGCHPDDFCYVCQADAVGCACDPDGDGCSMNLVCDAELETCREPLTCDDCELPELCQEADEDGDDAICPEICVDGFGWVTEECRPQTCSENGANSRLQECAALHRACRADALGGFCGACVEGYLEEGGNCRPVSSCDDIDRMCQNQARACDAGTSTTDATCGDCLRGLAEEDGSCVPADGSNCLDDDPSSLRAYCRGQNRICVPGVADAPASCGDCLGSFVVNPLTGACEARRSCVDAGCTGLGRSCENEPFATCGACLEDLKPVDADDPTSACVSRLTCFHLDCGDEFCVESESLGDAHCAPSECPPGEAYSDWTMGCVACGFSCCDYDLATGACTPDEGTTGRLYLDTRTGSETCICETLPGYFFDSSLAYAALECDADGDGWVRSAAESFVNSEEPTLRANARCDVHNVETITLINEWDQTYVLKLCDDGQTLLRGEEDGDCGTRLPIALYENSLLDREDAITGSGFPSYQTDGVGRRPTAAEVNPLTKACIDTYADFNLNRIPDIVEAQGLSIDGVDLTDRQLILSNFTYFVETHRSWYEPRPLERFGTYVISERSRCDAELAEVPFPLDYTPAAAGDRGTYWRECTRNRRVDFDLDNMSSGFDFARWSCSETTGGCPMPPAPTIITPDGFIPEHGLCELPLPPDDVWRGMNHHSQFRCVELVGEVEEVGYQLTLGDLYDPMDNSEALYQFNDCAVPCDGDDCEGTSEDSRFGDNPQSLRLACDTSVTPSEGDVGFVSVRYLDSDGTGYQYEQGCIDESEVWPQLCPGFAINGLLGTVADGRFNDFGALVCGCGVNYGGRNCEIGCPKVMVDANYSPVPRDGTWLCGGIEASYPLDDTYGPRLVGTNGDDRYMLHGYVPHVSVVREQLCEAGECGTGFAVW